MEKERGCTTKGPDILGIRSIRISQHARAAGHALD
jgi:hypothetical protein